MSDFGQPQSEEGFWVVEVDLRCRETALLPGCGGIYLTVECVVQLITDVQTESSLALVGKKDLMNKIL